MARITNPRWENLTPKQKMNKELLKARNSYEKLLVAASYGNLDLANELIGHGTPINPKRDEFTATPLYYAAHNGHLEMVRFLVENGADVNQEVRRHGNNTALKIAIARGHLNVVTFLMENHADVNHIVSMTEGTALEDVLARANFNDPIYTENVLNLLINAGADLYINGTTPEEKLERAKLYINNLIMLTKEEKLERIAILERFLLSPVKDKNIETKSLTTTNHSSIIPLLVNNSAIYNTQLKVEKIEKQEMDIVSEKENPEEISNVQLRSSM